MTLVKTLRLSVFPAFALTLIVPLFTWTNWWAWPDYLNASVKAQAAGLLLLTGGVGLLLNRIEWTRPINGYLALFIVWAFLSAFWSIDPAQTILLTGALVIYALAFAMFWRQPNEQRSKAFFYSAIIFMLGVVALGIYLGPTDRSFGGITANNLAHLGMAAIVLSHYAKRWIVPCLVFGLALIIYSQGRTVLACTGLFLTLHYVVMPWVYRLKARWLGLALLALSSGAGLILYPIIAPQIVGGLSVATRVDNAARLGTDLTGRERLWNLGIDAWEDRPLTGYGFNTRGDLRAGNSATQNAHSGMINLLLDVGAIGALLFALWYFAAVYYSFDPSGRFRTNPLQVSSAYLISFIPMMVTEPNYLSLYHPTSFILLFALTCPSGIGLLSARDANPNGASRKFNNARRAVPELIRNRAGANLRHRSRQIASLTSAPVRPH